MSWKPKKKRSKSLKPKLEKRKYHQRGIRFVIKNALAGLFLDPGLGKTSIILEAFRKLKAKGEVQKMLVIAGTVRITTSTWPSEIEKWREFEGLTYTVLHGGKKEKNLQEDVDIYIINVEGVAWVLKQIKARKFLPPDMLAIDESTKFKNHTAQRFKEIKPYLEMFKRRYIMTGTPAPRDLINLWSQIYLIDRGYTFGQYITHFRNKYFMSTGYGGYTYVPYEWTEKEIIEKTKDFILRIDDSELDLPELVEVVRELELPKRARETYDKMEKDFIIKLEAGHSMAPNTAASLIKCRQIANGGLYVENYNAATEHMYRSPIHLHDVKTEAAIEIIEERQGHPTIIAYEFGHDLERLRRAFGSKVPHIGSGVSPKKSKQIEDKWNRGEIPVLLAHANSISHGLNIQYGGNAIILYSLTYDLETYIQLYRRIKRSGQKYSHVFMYLLTMKDTVDEAMISALKHKDEGQTRLLQAFKEYSDRRHK